MTVLPTAIRAAVDLGDLDMRQRGDGGRDWQARRASEAFLQPDLPRAQSKR